MTPHKWTDDENALVERYYVRHGARWLAQRLGLTEKQVRGKARKLGVAARTPAPGQVLLADAALDMGLRVQSVYRRAVKDGVLKRVGRRSDGEARFTTVPRKWVEAQVAPLREEVAAAGAGWTPIEEAARRWGVTRKTATAGLRGQGWVAQVIRDAGLTVRHALAHPPRGPKRIVVHPVDVDMVRAAMEKRARVVAGMVPVKALMVDLGVSHHVMRRRLRELGITPQSLLRRNTRALFVTADEAQRVLEVYGAPLRRAA